MKPTNDARYLPCSTRHSALMAVARSAVVVCLPIASVSACSTKDSGPSTQASRAQDDACSPSDAVACSCPDGDSGSRSCNANGFLASECTCDETVTGRDDADVIPDDAGVIPDDADVIPDGTDASTDNSADGTDNSADDTDTTPDNADLTPDSPDTPPATGPGTVISEPQDEAAYIYDQDQLRTFDVEIEQADLDAVDADPAGEQYVPAVLHFEGVAYDVGYRYKGSAGAFLSPCTSGFRSGPKTGKCSVKLSFNWPDPQARFFGLKKLQFHAMNADPSMLRERLGYSLFREMGVPASRATHAILRVNGQAELFALIEQIDGRFTRSRFTEGGEGNLYKEVWPVHPEPETYLNALKTNTDEEPSADRVLRFKDASLGGSATMEDWIDRDLMARYMAADRVMLNDDGAFHFYCIPLATGNNPTLPGNHNYYWYEAAEFDRFWLIPWDLDHSMNDDRGPAHIASDWRQSPDSLSCGGCGDFGFGASPSPACDPVVQNFQDWMTDYDTEVEEFINGPFSKANVDAKLGAWRAQIQQAGFSVPTDAFNELGEILDRARANRGFPY